ncbi:MAG: hypothetical protein H6Q69_1674 [Firmicutes bacterium]|nr:hypothetical protein [Bacillota bacterium]
MRKGNKGIGGYYSEKLLLLKIWFHLGLFQDGELAELYSDWDIELYQSYFFVDEHSNGIKHRHPINKIVARKKCKNNGAL